MTTPPHRISPGIKLSKLERKLSDTKSKASTLKPMRESLKLNNYVKDPIKLVCHHSCNHVNAANRKQNTSPARSRMYTNNVDKPIKKYEPVQRVTLRSRTYLPRLKLMASETTKVEKKPPIYYISDLIEAMKTYTQSDNDSIFISHLLMAIHAFKDFRYSIVPPKPHLTVDVGWNNFQFDRTIILDLDETLIHSSYENEATFYHDHYEIMMEEGDSIATIYINIRPSLIESLLKLAKHFNLGIFTAATEIYADKILDEIDPDRKLFCFRLYRQHCLIKSNHNKIKDLRVIEGIDLSKTILVDNCPNSAQFQRQNLIPILPFTDDETDEQLAKLSGYLIDNFATTGENFQIMLSKQFQLNRYADFNTAKDLIDALYRFPSS